MALLGYTRISTVHRDDELRKMGVEADRIYSDIASGTKEARTRPGMERPSGFARPGDTVVVWRIDRLGRSLRDVLATMHELLERNIAVQSISDGVDPATTTGRLMGTCSARWRSVDES